MGNVIRRTLQIFLVIVLLFVLLALGLVFFFDVNRLKPFIIERVYQVTGYELVMDGDLSWSFFPNIGITSGHLGLKNPPGSKTLYLAEADRLRFSVQLMPLLSGQIEAGTIAAMNASGQWNDPVTHQSVSVSHLNGWADRISLTQAFPLQMAFDFVTQNPLASGHVSVTGSVSVNLDTKEYALRQLVMKATVRSGESHVKLQLGGNLLADLKQGLYRFEELTGKAANMPFSGDLQLLKKIRAETTGTLRIGPFDLREFLQQTGSDAAVLQEAEAVSGQIDLSMNESGAEASGIFNAPSMRVDKLQLKNLSVPFRFQNSVLDVEAAKADFYQGKVLLKTIAKMQTQPWQYAIQLGLNGVQLEPLLRDLNGNVRATVSGVGNVGLLVSSSGENAAAFLNHLAGTARFSVSEGMLRGIDIGYLLDSAMALAGKRISPTSQGNTAFSTLTGTAVIRDGVVTNNDLQLESSRFTASGKGTIDLPANRINYALEAYLRKTSGAQKDDISTLYGLPVPVVISGSLDDPKVGLDSKTLMEAIAKQQIRKAAGNLIPKNIQGQLPGNAGKVLNQLLGQ